MSRSKTGYEPSTWGLFYYRFIERGETPQSMRDQLPAHYRKEERDGPTERSRTKQTAGK